MRIIKRCNRCYNRKQNSNACIDCFNDDHFVDKKRGRKIAFRLKKAQKKLLYELRYERIKNKKI